MKTHWKYSIKEGIKIIAAFLAIIEFFLMRLPQVQWLRFLSKKVIDINILRLILIVFIVIVLYSFVPSRYRRIKNRKRAEKFRNNWNEFKDVLIEYSKSGNNSLQEKYSNLRAILEREFGFFRPMILEIESLGHKTEHLDGVLINFELCFSVREISRWSDKIQRGIPDELDCFDYLLIALVGFYENK